jgi:hypothetical protein
MRLRIKLRTSFSHPSDFGLCSKAAPQEPGPKATLTEQRLLQNPPTPAETIIPRYANWNRRD